MKENDLPTRLKQLTIKHSGLSQAISQSLLDAIMAGTLKHGEQLVEADLQIQFQVSKSPVREALRNLASMGLVTIKPRKGAFVRSFSAKDVEDNYEVRIVLEGLAARLAYLRMEEEDVQLLERYYRKMEQAVKHSNRDVYWDYLHKFHDLYMKCSRNDVLIETLGTLRLHNYWYQKHADIDLDEDIEPYRKLMHYFTLHTSNEEEIETLVRKNLVGQGLHKFREYRKKKSEKSNLPPKN